MQVTVWLPDATAAPLVAQFAREGIIAVSVTTGAEVDSRLVLTDLLIVPADVRVLTAELLQRCDRARVRVVPLASDDRAVALAAGFGLTAVRTPRASEVLAALSAIPDTAPPTRAGVIAVWSAAGAPGRTTVAASLAVELATNARVCLIDADTHAPSLALAVGLDEDRPGIAGACRQMARDVFDAGEYARIRDVPAPLGGNVEVLVGINRPARWPELRAERLRDAVQRIGGWVQHVVIDVAAPIEAISAEDGIPQRNEATQSALECADRIVMVTQADPVSIARFIRAHAELRELVPHTPVIAVVNRTRGAAVGIDPRAQLRSALERLAGVTDTVFIPDEPAATDRALRTACPVVLAAPRSSFAAAVRRLATRLRELDTTASGTGRVDRVKRARRTSRMRPSLGSAAP